MSADCVIIASQNACKIKDFAYFGRRPVMKGRLTKGRKGTNGSRRGPLPKDSPCCFLSKPVGYLGVKRQSKRPSGGSESRVHGAVNHTAFFKADFSGMELNGMNIVLCGFMGCGKTTVGRMAARRLGIPFVDMDACIEEQAGMTVSEIFAVKGEPAFRRMETEVARQLSGQDNLMIATGGGTVLNPENAALLKQNGVIVLLQVSPETVLWRLRNNSTRPLLQRPDKAEAVRALMAERMPAYKHAAGIILNANMPSGQVAAQLSHLAKKYIDKQVRLVL